MNPSTFEGFGTAAIHAGQDPGKWDMNQIVPPISLATTYKQNQPNEPICYPYSRDGNPTRDVLEQNLAVLEGASYCRVFSSGTSAMTSMTNILHSGDHILCFDDAYAGTKSYFEKVAVKHHNMQLDYVDLTNLKIVKGALKQNTKLVWFESPSNPLLKIVDIEEVVKIVKQFNQEIIVVIDNTFMSPTFSDHLHLELMLSTTRSLNEHLLFHQITSGTFPSAFDCFLVNRGIKTLHVRMQVHLSNGLKVANFLEAHSAVHKVLYPELKSHPQHDIHKKQTKGMSGMMSFYLKGGLQESKTFLANLKIFTLAESLGGVESLAQIPSLMTHALIPEKDRIALGITDSLIRISVGLEDVKDLIEDLKQALDRAFDNLNNEKMYSLEYFYYALAVVIVSLLYFCDIFSIKQCILKLDCNKNASKIKAKKKDLVLLVKYPSGSRDSLSPHSVEIFKAFCKLDLFFDTAEESDNMSTKAFTNYIKNQTSQSSPDLHVEPDQLSLFPFKALLSFLNRFNQADRKGMAYLRQQICKQGSGKCSCSA
uniref:cystathionine gamma-lyase n=1 Tax=Ditylenchus dipsaci TaxID=166011 RepID=A0A915DKP1_9BILA